ncbi:putative leucine-rich repeat-containing protein DDB_G0290503 isoform X2 [Eleutherodactylus coqui]|uniref:putative leucine-rich repeat-containing protein DDB_G0290503 isoform X2 n=1 Tax=Eleutherodactylus coqui TaxID=57060 RepID=UPI003463420E
MTTFFLTCLLSSRGAMDSAECNVEGEYIKNLQQQIYFLELEANLLRKQTKKATDLQPQLTLEADHLYRKLLDLRSECDSLKLEVKRKYAHILMLQRDQEALGEQIREAEDSHSKERQQLIENIVQLKKGKELTDRRMTQKEMDTLLNKQELERELISVTNSSQRITALQTQLKQRMEQQKELEEQLSQKRMELLKVNSARHEMEEKLIKHSAETQNLLSLDLRNEISFLHQQIREKHLLSEQEKVLRQKMVNDCAKLANENNALQTQQLELTKKMEMKALKEDNYIHSSTSIAQLLSVKNKEEQLIKQVQMQQEFFKKATEHFKDLMGQIDLLLSGNGVEDLRATTLSSQIAEMQAILVKEEQINTELRRDKTLLVDHISSLQSQITKKEDELLDISLQIEELDKHLSAIQSEHSMQRSLQSVKWKGISDLARSMKKLSQSLSDPHTDKY